ncbi:iron-siderophore ABC transporter substrate-binding protein [Chlorogloeopsis sp. ULAP01]|uniref:iron-siderophore ABC transporter substrate-binding protein n=1 Tax=Chlorogloeopsis sp. ULAP01 TaxID=3056483 RepID=UPI0025AAB186|nr:iron-siderophore ABC transporter substrate-binding protein [Chlorogloeopsis sp. ULAP01]MDM9382616.1 iron-siderophore ABC transporter substrate-binding protein [Chlorogloeopsis sp. ULAP01]
MNMSQNATRLRQPLEECRVVQHVMGKTCVPKSPERLVTIFHVTLGNALVLGIKPIGSATGLNSSQKEDFATYLKDKIVGIKQLGSQYEPNIEMLLLVKPDLILGWEIVQRTYPIISQISPTVLGKWQGEPLWREYFHFVAEVLGKEEAEQQAWNHYYRRIKELKIALNNQYTSKTISVISVYSGSPINIITKNSFVGSILNDIGLPRPKTQSVVVPGGSYVISEENLKDADGDILFILFTGNNNDRKAIEELQQKPLWKTLKAVQQGQVYSVDELTWVGSNLLAADAVIDDLYKYLVKNP